MESHHAVTAIYFRFIRFSLGLDEGRDFLSGTALRGFDWEAFYAFSAKQTLLGVTFDGVRRLPKAVAPGLGLLGSWLAASQQIKRRNKQLNEATAAISRMVEAGGYRCCILKGQGNAMMYPAPSVRAPGDVDVWVDAPREEIRALARLLAQDWGRVDEESLSHIGLTLNGVSVELHATPGFMAHFVYNRRLQRWLRQNVETQCAHRVSLPDGAGEVAVPTIAFNVIYQLYHLYHHYFYEGVGLRQVIDYYFVVRQWRVEHTAEADLSALQRDLKRMGLWAFARAMMYVLHEVMGLSAAQMIAPMDARRGRMLLGDILAGGNFGHYYVRHAWLGIAMGQEGRARRGLGHNLLRLCRDARLLRYYPAEALSEPLFRLWHWWWRRKNGGLS